MKQKSRSTIAFFIGVALLCTVSLISVLIGSYPLSFSDIVHILMGQQEDAMAVKVFFTLRLPRVGVGILSGLSLGMAGAVFQLLFRNPLAAPDLVGVSSGASLGTAAAIVLGAGSVMQMMTGAFFGGMAALLFVLLLVRVSGSNRPGTYILAGIAISALSNAFIMLLKYMADTEGELAAIDFWTMGSLASVTATKFKLMLPPVLVSLGLLMLFQKEIRVLSLGDEQATFLGMRSNRMRMLLLVLCTLATASVISVTGVISFVGLLAPHIAFLLTGRRSHGYLLLSGLVGGILVVIADCFARSVTGGELPTSILTTLCAVPFFVYFLWKRRGGI